MWLYCVLLSWIRTRKSWNIYAAFELFIKLHFHSSRIIFPSPNTVSPLAFLYTTKWDLLEFIECVYVCQGLCPYTFIIVILLLDAAPTKLCRGYWSCGRWCPDARGWSSGHQLTCRSRSQSWQRWSWRGKCGRWRTLGAGSPPPWGPSASTPAPGKRSFQHYRVVKKQTVDSI